MIALNKEITNKDKKLTESKIDYNEFGWYTDSKGNTHFRDIESSKLFNKMLFNGEIDIDGNLL